MCLRRRGIVERERQMYGRWAGNILHVNWREMWVTREKGRLKISELPTRNDPFARELKGRGHQRCGVRASHRLVLVPLLLEWRTVLLILVGVMGGWAREGMKRDIRGGKAGSR